MAGLLSLDNLKQALARKPPVPAYLVTGTEAVLRDEAVAAIIDAALDPSLRDFNLDLVNAGEVDPEQLAGICTSLPMMADRRVVVVRDIGAWRRRTRGRDAMATLLQQPAPETVVIMVESDLDPADSKDKTDKTLAGLAQVVRCDALDEEAAVAWVRERAQSVGVTLQPAAAAHLVAVAGTDLGGLRSELQKLEALAGSDPVSAERIGDLVGVRFGETSDDWVGAVLAGKVAESLRLLPVVLSQSGVSGVRLVTSLGSHFLLLGVARAAHDKRMPARGINKLLWDTLKRERPGGLGPWGPAVDRLAGAVRNWSLQGIATSLEALLDADRALKNTGLANEQAVLTELLLRLPSGRRAVA